MINKYLLLLFFLLPIFAFTETFAPAASRMENGNIYYYTSLHEALEASTGICIDNPDEIILLLDMIMDRPIEIDDRMHIRLVPGGGNRIIQRGPDNIEFPVIWVNGELSSLALGKQNMEYELFIDGGYLNDQPGSIQAHAPLIYVSGLDAKLVLYDKVFLQNNHNIGTGLNNYQFGSGVYIRTNNDNNSRQSEFIMKGGTIRGNTNNTRNSYPNGGGVLIIGFGIFTMEGGIIMNNTSQSQGGGFNTQVSGTFKKTGGIIYGTDAPGGYRNTVMEGSDYPVIYGHAVNVQHSISQTLRYRDDTIRENENLTYLGSPTGNGVFGKGEKWSRPGAGLNRLILICILTALALIISILIYLRKKQLKEAAINNTVEPGVHLTPREKEVFNLLLSGYTARQIAKTLQLSVSSINFHSQNIYHKLGIHSCTELLTKFKKTS